MHEMTSYTADKVVEFLDAEAFKIERAAAAKALHGPGHRATRARLRARALDMRHAVAAINGGEGVARWRR